MGFTPLSEMNKQSLLSLPELHAHAHFIFDGTFKNDQDCLMEACSTGIYHEEDGDLAWVEFRLSREDLGRLFPSICHALVRGAGHCEETEGIEVILKCHGALVQWIREDLDSSDLLIDALAKVRALVLEGAKENPGAWWHRIVQNMKILETGILRREGREPALEINREYHEAEHF